MTLSDVFKINCRATASLCKNSPELSFRDLTSGFSGKNKNETVARFSFNNYFIDLYFIETGHLAYASNTIWLSVGFDCVSFLPFSVYDILAFDSPNNFKCYTYTYLQNSEILIQAFAEINDFFKTFIPLMDDISQNGVKKNKLIAAQKDAISKFVGDDIFQREIEILEASLKIRDMLIKNYFESVISHFISGGAAEFHNGNLQKAIKKLEKTKHKTLYEENLLRALKNGELKDYNASPFRDEHYKNHAKNAKKSSFSFSKGGAWRFIIPTIINTPLFTLLLFALYIILSTLKFSDFNFAFTINYEAFVTLFLAGFLLSEIFSFHFSFKFKSPFKLKGSDKIKSKKTSKPFKYFTIFVETIVILLLFSSVNNTIAFTENKVYFPEDEYISLKQNSIRYENFETVYRVSSYYIFDTKKVNFEHYVLVSKNGEQLNLAPFPESRTKEFEETILPLFTENGCEIIEIESERDIK